MHSACRFNHPRNLHLLRAGLLGEDVNCLYVSRDASTGREMLVAPVLDDAGRPVLANDRAAGSVRRTRFRLSVSPAVRSDWDPPRDLSRATWQRKTIPPSAPPMNVILKTAAGGQLDLQLHPTSSIREVKLQIRERMRESFDRNRLMWGRQELEDELAVSDYPIQNGDVLEVRPAAPDPPPAPRGSGTLRAVPFVLPRPEHYPHPIPAQSLALTHSPQAGTPGRHREGEPRPRHERASPQLFFEVFCHQPS